MKIQVSCTLGCVLPHSRTLAMSCPTAADEQNPLEHSWHSWGSRFPAQNGKTLAKNKIGRYKILPSFPIKELITL